MQKVGLASLIASVETERLGISLILRLDPIHRDCLQPDIVHSFVGGEGYLDLGVENVLVLSLDSQLVRVVQIQLLVQINLGQVLLVLRGGSRSSLRLIHPFLALIRSSLLKLI